MRQHENVVFPKKTMKNVALNARLSPFKKPTTFFSTFFAVFENEHLNGFVHVAECLINEDCPDTDYCDPNTRSCTDACNLNGAML